MEQPKRYLLNAGGLVSAIALTMGLLSTSRADDGDSTGHITIKKGPENANPTLALTEFRGPQEKRKRFLRILRTADWFRIRKQKNKATYRLAAAYQEGNGKPGVQLVLRAPASEQFSAEVSASNAQASDTVLYRAVDTLIERVFDRPGPCESRIAFVAQTGESKDIYTSSFVLTDVAQLTNNNSISTEPSWGTRGRYLLYTLYRNQRTHITLVDVRNQRQRLIASQPGLNASAALHRRTNRVALSRSIGDQVDLFIKDMKTGQYTRLTNDSYVESSPAWSPDGKRLCYVSNVSGSPQLHIVSVADGNAQPVASIFSQAVSPDWSPVTDKIIFSAKHQGHYILATTKPGADGDPEIVISEPGDWESPSWGPDGRHAICSHTQGNQTRLAIIDTRHGTVTHLTKPGNFALPVWTRKTTN